MTDPRSVAKSLVRAGFAMLSSAALDLLRGERDVATPVPADDREPTAADRKVRRCEVCGVQLSAYNPNPNCWRHTIGRPWRGPTARPKY